MNLDQAQLQKQSKELEAKQEYIDSQLKFLEDAPLSVKVYEARIKAAESKLKDLESDGNTKIEQASQGLESIRLDHKRLLDSNRELKSDIRTKEEEVNLLDRRLTGLKKAIKEAQSSLDERKRYMNAQEEMIDLAAIEANEKLLELKEMVDGLTDDIKELTIKKIALEKHTDTLASGIDLQEAALNDQEKQFEDQKAGFSRELNTMEKLIADKKAEYQTVSSQADKKLALVREKELSIKAKADAVILERQTLATEKRRFESRQELL